MIERTTVPVIDIISTTLTSANANLLNSFKNTSAMNEIEDIKINDRRKATKTVTTLSTPTVETSTEDDYFSTTLTSKNANNPLSTSSRDQEAIEKITLNSITTARSTETAETSTEDVMPLAGLTSMKFDINEYDRRSTSSPKIQDNTYKERISEVLSIKAYTTLPTPTAETTTEDDTYSTTLISKNPNDSHLSSKMKMGTRELSDTKITANVFHLDKGENNCTLKTVTFAVVPFVARRTLMDLIITKIVKYVTVSRTTPKSTIPDLHSIYLKSKRIRDHIKRNMVKYKIRKIENRRIDEKLGKKRGVPKLNITTTKRVPMRKSKYYIRKYVRKDLYKMTTTTPKPTRDPWKYWTMEKVIRKKSKREKLLELYQQRQAS